MEWSSVVSMLRPRVAIPRQRILALVAAGLVLASFACSNSDGPTSPSSRVTDGTSPPTETTSPPVPQPPYIVRGLVRNGHGVPVPGAEVWIYGNNSPIDNRYGVTWTDGTGHYTVSSPQRVPHAVRAMKDGHIPRDVSILGAPDTASTWTVDVVLVHIDRYALLPIAPLAVGGTARLEAHTDLDDGSTSRGFLYMQLTSSNPSVLHVERTGWVQAVAPGTATVTATYYGITTTLQIRVDASE